MALLAGAGTARGEFAAEPGSPFAAGVQPFQVAVGDFNGDGRPDLVLANPGSNDVTILLRQADGGFEEEAGSPVAVGMGPDSVAVADFNADERPDLAVSNYDSNDVTILLRQADGGFAEEAGSPLAAGAQPRSVVAADFNADDRPDLAVSHRNSQDLHVFLRQPGGGFAAEGSPVPVGTLPFSISVADFNADGRPDLAVSNQGSNDVSILLRQEAGGFAPEAASPVDVGSTPLGTAVADFNADGRPDLSVANQGSNDVTILLRQAGGGFAEDPGSPARAGAGPYGVVAVDLNEDSRPDLAVTNQFSDDVTVLLRQPLGGFVEQAGSPVATGGNDPLRLADADFNADGLLDLAIPNYGSNDVSVLLGAPETTITVGPPELANDPTPTFEFSSDRPAAVFECQVDGGGFEACTSPHTTAPLADGEHEFSVRALATTAAARDDGWAQALHLATGGEDPTPARRKFTVDTAPPETMITAGPTGTVTAAPSYEFQASEAGATFECRVVERDAPVPGFAFCTSPHTTPVSRPNAYTFEVRGIDRAGNGDPTPASRAFEFRPPLAGPPLNVERPRILQTSDPRTYVCDEGVWERPPANPAYRYGWWLRTRSGSPLALFTYTLVSTGRSYTLKSGEAGMTFYCEVSVANAYGTGRAYSNDTVLTGIRDFGPIVLPGRPYGNFRVRGIDVFQTVQPSSGAEMYGFPSGAFARLAGGGTPTSWLDGSPPFLPAGAAAQRTPYVGVSLDQTKRAWAVAYVDMANTSTPLPAQPLEVTLVARLDGRQLGQPLTQTITNPPVSTTAYVRLGERDDLRYGVQFQLPASWLAAAVLSRQRFDLEATVDLTFRAKLAGVRECSGVNTCSTDDRFRLDDLPVFRLPQLGVQTLALRVPGQAPSPAADSVLATGIRLFPGGELMTVLPYAAVLDIGFEANLSFADHECNDLEFDDVRSCRMYYVGQRVERWYWDNAPERQDYDILLGTHSYMLPSGNLEPGWKWGPDLAAGPGGVAKKFTANDGGLGRPFTAAAHELGHVMSLPHIEEPSLGACGQPGDPEMWPPDRAGRLQSVAFGLSGAAVAGRIDPVVDTNGNLFEGLAPNNLFDLMSYCAAEANAWLSARNWNRAFQTLLDFDARLRAGGTSASHARAAYGGRLQASEALGAARFGEGFAVGMIGPGGGTITRVVPPDGRDAVPADVSSSRSGCGR